LALSKEVGGISYRRKRGNIQISERRKRPFPQEGARARKKGKKTVTGNIRNWRSRVGLFEKLQDQKSVGLLKEKERSSPDISGKRYPLPSIAVNKQEGGGQQSSHASSTPWRKNGT